MAPTGTGKETINAPYRIKLALDRTMLAWVRTALAMASFGFAIVAFFRALHFAAPTPQATRLHQGAIRFGTALLILAVVVTIGSGLVHWRALRRLRRGEPLTLGQWPLSVTLGFLVAAFGVLGLWIVFHR
jgi:putative membrane protein